MALDPKAEATLALHRFGFGPRAGSVNAIAADPRGALIAEIDRAGAGRIDNADLPTSSAAMRAAVAFNQATQAKRKAERAERNAAQQQAGNAAPDSAMQNGTDAPAPRPPRPNTPPVPQQLFLNEAKARFTAALDAETGFAERLAWFWSNHFCVSADKGGVRPIAGAYEREAIRAHMLGRFSDMLLAVESHPAMLLYLDNARSIGPDSPAGRNRGKGLNENLAREIMELHTLGVRTGYTQDDVTRFANVVTGWSIIPPRQDPVRGGEFTFSPRMHEPGPQTVIGKSYADSGVEQGREVLLALARHPATAKHIATKLARHFVADDPPLALVDWLTKRFLDTDGDLKEVTKALLAAPEAWSSSREKLKRPGEWIVAALRATGVTNPDIGPLIQAQNVLGEPLWRPPAPIGFSDDDATWLDGLPQRLDLANQAARRVAGNIDAKAAFEDSIGPIASAETRQTIMRAESRQQALALLFMSPEFQRR